MVEQISKRRPGMAAELLDLLDAFLDEAGHWESWRRTARALQEAAHAAGDRRALAAATISLADVEFRFGRHSIACELAQRGVNHARSIRCSPTTATALNNLANIYAHQGRLDDAVLCYEESRDLFVASGWEAMAALLLSHIGNAYLQQGRWRDGMDFLRRGLTLQNELGSPRARAHTLYFIAKAYDDAEEFGEAVDHYSRSLEMCHQLGLHRFEALIRRRLAKTLLQVGNRDRALREAETAAAIFVRVGDDAARSTAEQLVRAARARTDVT